MSSGAASATFTMLRSRATACVANVDCGPGRDTVTADSEGLRLDRFLTAILPAHSRSQIQRLIKEGLIHIAGRETKANQPVKAGQAISIDLPEPVDPVPQPEALPLPILYQDEDLIVVDKPAGMVVHPAVGHRTGTLDADEDCALQA